MKYAEDLTGSKFGRLAVIERVYVEGSRRVHWLCECECGTKKVVRGSHLRAGKIVSCGCYRTEQAAKALTTHKQTNSRLYYVWRNMLNRCYNKNVRSYKNYGMNGVTVCDQWRHDFGAFSKWAFANGYDPDAPYGKCTIDRINVYEGYTPDNCRWVDLKEQAHNKREKVKHEQKHTTG